MDNRCVSESQKKPMNINQLSIVKKHCVSTLTNFPLRKKLI